MESDVTGVPERISISKRVRFEVFKRDSFTCQYCGAEAPTVILHVDHLNPVSLGGDNEITNLVTACESCNLGKSNVPLSDISAASKQKAQLNILQERREQLEMIMEWRKGLLEFDVEVLDKASDYFTDVTGYELSEVGRKKLHRAVKQFGVTEVLTALDEEVVTYGRYDDAGKMLSESATTIINKLGPFCSVRKKSADEPYLKAIYYTRGILRNRLRDNITRYNVIGFMSKAAKEGVPTVAIQECAKRATTWRGFENEVEELIRNYKS